MFLRQTYERNRAAWEQLQRQGEAARAAAAGAGPGQGPNPPGSNPGHNPHASHQTAWEHLQRQHQAAAAAKAAARAARDGAKAANGARRKFREVQRLPICQSCLLEDRDGCGCPCLQ